MKVASVAPFQHGRDRYRINVDSLLLASFAPRVRGRVFDLGAGVGVVGIAIAKMNPAAEVTLVEVDEPSTLLARKNIEALGLGDRVSIACKDVRDLGERGSAALVVCNPPYVPIGKGRAPKDARARMGDAATFVRAARRLLGRRGRACFVYPTTHLVDLLGAMRAAGLEPKRMRFVHPRKDAPARIVLIESVAGKPGGLVVQDPLVQDQAAALSR